MLVSPHVTAGVALGAIIGNPLVVIPVAILSHFVLDSIPHWQETLAPYTPTKKTFIRIPIDLALALGIVLLGLQLRPDHAWAMWLGAIFASGADLDVMLIAYPKFKRGLIEKYWDWHCAIQRETSSLWGLAPQLVILMVGVFAIYHA